MDCNKCSSKIILNTLIIKEKKECSGCNLGIFGNCYCRYIDVKINKYMCNICNIELNKCNQCNKYFDILIQNKCLDCIENIKNNNPSNDNEIYEFDEKYLKWNLIEKKYICITCNNSKFYKKIHNVFKYYYYEYNCSGCKIKDLKYIYNDLLFKIKFTEINEEILFKKICICNNYTEWINICYLNENNNLNNILQCKECDPSTNFKKYFYSCHQNKWFLEKEGKKCNLCEIILWKNNRDFWGDIIQCDIHKPLNNFIKYKFTNTGYNIDKIKEFNGNKHIWKNLSIKIDINYKCLCNKCNS